MNKEPMIADERAEKVKMSPHFNTVTEKENFMRLAEGIKHNAPDMSEADFNHLLGTGKLFFDLGKGIDIWDVTE
jgi:hypothetical protein